MSSVPNPFADPVVAEPILEAAPAAGPAQPLPPGAQVKLVCQRGVKVGMEYPVYEGKNYIGRTDELPVDIDLENQERPDNVWTSRQHAVISYENSLLTVEDLNSANWTYINRIRVLPGSQQPIRDGDVVQIGSVHLKVVIS